MNRNALVSPAALALAIVLAAAPALADPPVRIVRAQFTDRVDHSAPVGSAASLAGAETAMYWLEINNGGHPTSITVVWRVDGREGARQSLPVGHAPRWRTWARHRLHGGHRVEVDVLDAAGTALRHDTIRL